MTYLNGFRQIIYRWTRRYDENAPDNNFDLEYQTFVGNGNFGWVEFLEGLSYMESTPGFFQITKNGELTGEAFIEVANLPLADNVVRNYIPSGLVKAEKDIKSSAL